MAGRTHVLLVLVSLTGAGGAQGDGLKADSSVRVGGGWTSNLNGGGDWLPADQRPIADDFGSVSAAVRVAGRPRRDVAWSARYQAAGEAVQAHPANSSLAHQLSAGGSYLTGWPVWSVDTGWTRKDYRGAGSDAGVRALAFSEWRTGAAVSLPLNAARSTSLLGSISRSHEAWPGDLQPASPPAPRVDITTTVRGGLRQAIGARTVFEYQLQYSRNTSSASAWRAGQRLDAGSYRAPGGVVGVACRLGSRVDISGAGQYQVRRFDSWEAGSPPRRERGAVLAATLTFMLQVSRSCSLDAGWSLIRSGSVDPGQVLGANRVTLGTTFAFPPS